MEFALFKGLSSIIFATNVHSWGMTVEEDVEISLRCAQARPKHPTSPKKMWGENSKKDVTTPIFFRNAKATDWESTAARGPLRVLQG